MLPRGKNKKAALLRVNVPLGATVKMEGRKLVIDGNVNPVKETKKELKGQKSQSRLINALKKLDTKLVGLLRKNLDKLNDKEKRLIDPDESCLLRHEIHNSSVASNKYMRRKSHNPISTISFKKLPMAECKIDLITETSSMKYSRCGMGDKTPSRRKIASHKRSDSHCPCQSSFANQSDIKTDTTINTGRSFKRRQRANPQPTSLFHNRSVSSATRLNYPIDVIEMSQWNESQELCTHRRRAKTRNPKPLSIIIPDASMAILTPATQKQCQPSQVFLKPSFKRTPLADKENRPPTTRRSSKHPGLQVQDYSLRLVR